MKFAFFVINQSPEGLPMKRVYDQGMEQLKRMRTLEIQEIGGRVVPTRMRMEKLDEPGRWTEIVITSAEFDIELPDRTFTVFALKAGAS